jgi:vacuolar-type H+-ATPase subunit I/STV1
MAKKSPMTLDKLGTKVDKLGFIVEKLANKTDTIEINLDKLTMTVDKLAEITVKSFNEVNNRLDKIDDKIDRTKYELKAEIGEIHHDMFNFERILMTEVERNDHQDLKINQLETKSCK